MVEEKGESSIKASDEVRNETIAEEKCSESEGHPVQQGSNGAADIHDETGQDWTTVTGKRHTVPKEKSLPSQTAEQMPIFAALSKSLSKGQLKRARRTAGRGSPKNK